MKYISELTLGIGEFPEFTYYIYQLSELESVCLSERIKDLDSRHIDLNTDKDYRYFISAAKLDDEEYEDLRPIDVINKLLLLMVLYRIGTFETYMEENQIWAIKKAALDLLSSYNIIPDNNPDQLRINFDDYKK